MNLGDGFEQPQPQPQPKAKAPTSNSRRRDDDTERGDAFGLTTPKPKPISTAQFAPTPRFSYGRPAHPSPLGMHQQQQQTSLERRPTLAQALRPRAAEDVQEVHDEHNDEDEDEEMLELQPDEEPALQTTENDINSSDDLPHSPKRRRRHSTSSKTPISTNHPTDPPTPQAQFQVQPQFHRPAFLPPPDSRPFILNNTSASTSPLLPIPLPLPLPEHFSPPSHRRGEKFLPGGMAATLQQWIVETGQEASRGRQRWRKGKGYFHSQNQNQAQNQFQAQFQNQEEENLVRVREDGNENGNGNGNGYGYGEKMILLRGRRISHRHRHYHQEEDEHEAEAETEAQLGRNMEEEQEEEMRLLLIVDTRDGKKALSSRRIVEGDVVGIKAPLWEVEVQGVRWAVGVDWKVLQ